MPTRPIWPPRTVLVAIDSNAHAPALVDRASTLALLLGAKLCIVHAVCVRAGEWPHDLSGLLEGLEVLDVDAHALVKRLARHAAMTGLVVSSVVLHGEPRRVLTEAVRSERADLVVLGARRNSSMARALLPDLRADLVALGTCAVLSLPFEAATDREARS